MVCLVWTGLGVSRFESSPKFLIFNRQVMDKQLDITGDDDVMQAAFFFVKGIEELDLYRCINVWETPARFTIMGTFWLYLLCYLATILLKHTFYGQTKSITAKLGSPRWRS